MPRAKSPFDKALEKRRSGQVDSEEIEQSHRENLQWAMAAAGRFLRTKQEPFTCPNDAAYFLYCEARDNPKEFLTKVNQAEVRANREGEGSRRGTNKSIEEIDKALEELGANEGSDSVQASSSEGSES